MPSKGRLQENTEGFFAAPACSSSSRAARATIAAPSPSLPGVEVAYLSAGEIADALAQGAVHLGITGEDLLREMIADIDKRVVMIEGLGFGFANVVVAVPQAWIDVRSMADLDDVATAFRLRHDRKMRVATKYMNLTRDFFSSFGIVDYRIVESSGATEGAPAAGSAELIVDITTTGATLAANGLKIVDDGIILRSQANLVAARGAAWGEAERETARRILDRIAAQAQGTRLPRGAHALPRLRRGDAGGGEDAIRRGGAVRRADLVGHADAALPAAGDLRSRELHARARRAEHHRRRDRIRVRAGQSAVRKADRRIVERRLTRAAWAALRGRTWSSRLADDADHDRPRRCRPAGSR